MTRIFADTSYWIALLNRRDELHLDAIRLSQQFGDPEIVTSEMVLTEFLNAFSGFGSQFRQAAADSVVSLKDSAVVIVPQTTNLFAEALRQYREMLDKNWSLTDCSSFAIMEVHGITEALTRDRHFNQAGFKALMR